MINATICATLTLPGVFVDVTTDDSSVVADVSVVGRRPEVTLETAMTVNIIT